MLVAKGCESSLSSTPLPLHASKLVNFEVEMTAADVVQLD
jgi:hypothetical protein